MPIIAEDLGVITPDVVQLRQDIGAPGMAVLQFAWGSGGANTHLPHNHYENCVVYPGAACPSAAVRVFVGRLCSTCQVVPVSTSQGVQHTHAHSWCWTCRHTRQRHNSGVVEGRGLEAGQGVFAKVSGPAEVPQS